MITCVNCSTEAVYDYRVSSGLTLKYCTQHLPKFLKGRKDASLKVSIIEKPKEEVVEEPKPAPKKRAPKKKKVEESTDGAD